MHDATIVSVEGAPTQLIRLEVRNFQFAPGQYLEVLHTRGVRIPLSIASSPSQLPFVELHYRSTPGNPEALAMDELLHGNRLRISPAAGEVVCPDPETPLVVIAGGSGAAQAFSLCAYRAEHHAHRTDVIWCVDHEAELYELERLRALTSNLTVCVDDRRTSDNEGLAWIDRHASEIRASAVILAGSPQFVYLVTDLLTRRGAADSQLQSDVYHYAPR